MKHLTTLLVLVCVLFGLVPLTGQDKEEPVMTTKTAVQEELRAYMGYEENLAALYLTLPYDVAVGNNQQSRLMDIGLLFAVFLPLLYLWSDKVRRRWRLLAAAFLIGYLAFISGFSMVIPPSGELIRLENASIDQVKEQTNYADGVSQALTADLYAAGQFIGTPIRQAIDFLSGPSDYVTYPLLIGLLLVSLLLVIDRLKSSPEDLRVLSLVFVFYGFLWWLFSGGIIWYGFLLVPVVYLFLTQYMLSHPAPLVPSFGKYAFWTLGAVWGIQAIILFLVNINYRSDTGLNMIDLPVQLYAMGYWNEDQVVDAYYPGVSKVMDRINADESALVYRAGTMLTFQVEKNDKRVFEDNLLDFFNQVATDFNDDKMTINEAFRRAGLKYLIVSLRLGVSDRTPEGTLRKKFERILNYLYQNPGITLLATDNRIKVANSPNTPNSSVEGVFGESDRQGTYAIFQLN